MALITIITSTFNSAKTLERLLLSIKNQTSNDYEFIIVDGGSNDGTTNIIQKYNNICDRVISEKDSGIYDAWNKGINCAHGEWITFVGSDDELIVTYIENITHIISKISHEVNLICCKVQCVNEHYQNTRVMGEAFNKKTFVKRFNIANVGALYKRSFLINNGLFDINYKIVGDYDFLLRNLNKVNSYYYNKIIAYMRDDGVSSQDNYLNVAREVIKTKKDNKYCCCMICYITAFKLFLIINIKKIHKHYQVNA